MSGEMFATIVFSLLSALISSFLASYLTYRYAEISRRRSRHFEDIKENCPKEVLSRVGSFKGHFYIGEGSIRDWVGSPSLSKPYSVWCVLFSFGFDDPPTSHYTILLHDLKNHFPDLVLKLKKFEEEMKRLCPEYGERLYELTRAVLESTRRVTGDETVRKILTEVVIMTLVGYDEWYYPNDKMFLENKEYIKYVDEIVEELKSKHSELVEEFIKVRSRGVELVREVESTIMKILHSHKLPGRCELL